MSAEAVEKEGILFYMYDFKSADARELYQLCINKGETVDPPALRVLNLCGRTGEYSNERACAIKQGGCGASTLLRRTRDGTKWGTCTRMPCCRSCPNFELEVAGCSVLLPSRRSAVPLSDCGMGI